MNKIEFVNGQAPALNANNLNLLQTNTEAISGSQFAKMFGADGV